MMEHNTAADDTNKDGESKKVEQVAEACSERLKSCLEESNVYTESRPQPKNVEVFKK